MSDNLGLITGNDEDNRIGEYPETKKEILDRFSPLSKNRKDIFGTAKEINLLVGTDAISTGQNLQDAVVLMNLDLPYNPMVLEQRIGRIDRPRQDSSVNNIFVYTFPVYEAIDVELQMSERLGKKMAGVMSDTEFDDIVLPEYTSYLEDVKRDKGKAVQTMLDRTVEKTIYNQGTVSEKHSTDYKEANKRLYDTKNSAIKRTEKPVYQKYSFSKNNSSHTIVVARINYKDANGAVISNEERIFDTSELSNSDITNAESHLRQSKIGGISSTAELLKEKSEILLGNELEKLEKYKQKLVDNFNQSVDTAKSNLQSLQNKTAEKAALEIANSVKDLKNRNLIMSKLQEAGLVPKDVSKIANVIRMVDEESELFQYVKEIAANVDRFWLDFTDYAELFDFSRLENSIGAKVKRASNRKANIEKTEIEVIIGNIVFS